MQLNWSATMGKKWIRNACFVVFIDNFFIGVQYIFVLFICLIWFRKITLKFGCLRVFIELPLIACHFATMTWSPYAYILAASCCVLREIRSTKPIFEPGRWTIVNSKGCNQSIHLARRLLYDLLVLFSRKIENKDIRSVITLSGLAYRYSSKCAFDQTIPRSSSSLILDI